MARRADDEPLDAAVVIVNPDDDVTPEAFNAWLDQLQTGEPRRLNVTAAEARASGEV